MGKVSPKEKMSKTSKQKRRAHGSNRYLKPGALAQLRNSKASASKLSADVGNKKIDAMDTENTLFQNECVYDSPVLLSPEKFRYSHVTGPLDVHKENNLQRTPKTPRDPFPELDGSDYDSRLESLPMELLVKVLCHLHHDQLKAVFHVSERVRKATVIARQFYFNYTTPDRSRQEILCTSTQPCEHFVSKGDDKDKGFKLPITPKAPRHGPRPPSRIKLTEMRQIAAVLFQESAFHPSYIVPSLIPKPICKSFGSNRVLFYDEELELCQAVAQNKLL
ncbi:F-box protein At4g35930-like [Bidens hawaiensis]|uniref:F-box protein At4g35930-like n=1 Tax=Bidens hawaiensis TaxID=980011 RepID=UPI00404B77AA